MTVVEKFPVLVSQGNEAMTQVHTYTLKPDEIMVYRSPVQAVRAAKNSSSPTNREQQKSLDNGVGERMEHRRKTGSKCRVDQSAGCGKPLSTATLFRLSGKMGF
jgi:hypothetical protein